MKTITEYQPLIFGRMQKRTELRAIRRTNLLNIMGRSLPIIYISAGLGLMAETGYMLWNWQFWLVLGPLFIACEAAFWALSQQKALKRAKAANAEEKQEAPPAPRWSSLRPLFSRSIKHRRVLSYPIIRVN